MDTIYNTYQPIGFNEVVRQIWQKRGFVASFAFAGLIAAIIYLHMATPLYTATLRLVPNQMQAQNSMSRFGSSIAALTGIDPTQMGGVSPFALYPEIMKSRAVADDLAARAPVLMTRLYEGQWDKRMGVWREPRGLGPTLRKRLKGILGLPARRWSPPSGADLQELIVDRVEVTRDTKNPIIMLSFRDRDPIFARQFLMELNRSVDQRLRLMTVTRSSQYISYLEEKIKVVDVAELRAALVASLSEQMTMKMMANSKSSFAAQVMGGVESSKNPTDPKALIILVLSTLIGIIIAVSIVCLPIIYPNVSKGPSKAGNG